MENNGEYKKFILFLEMFQNRPHHLAKFMLENNMLSAEFLNKLSDTSLGRITDINKMKEEVYFKNISDMRRYYRSLVYDISEDRGGKSKEEWEFDINERLHKAIDDENYEEACRLRDYMKKNGIKRKPF